MLGFVVIIISLLIIIDIISREQNLTDVVLKVSTNHGPELPLLKGLAS